MRVYRYKKDGKLYTLHEVQMGLGVSYVAEEYPLSRGIVSGVRLNDFECVGER